MGGNDLGGRPNISRHKAGMLLNEASSLHSPTSTLAEVGQVGYSACVGSTQEESSLQLATRGSLFSHPSSEELTLHKPEGLPSVHAKSQNPWSSTNLPISLPLE